MPDYLDKFTEKKKDGTPIQSVPIRDSDAQERLATVEGKLTTDTTSASGNPLSIVGLKSTQNAINPVITLDPIQDLHGQDKPYPAGGGKNKLNADDYYGSYKQSDGSYKTTAINFYSIYIYATNDMIGKTYTFSAYLDLTKEASPSAVLTRCVIGGVNGNGTTISANNKGLSSVSFTPTSTSDYVYLTYGSNGGNNYTISQLQIEEGETATAYAPYSNICPITGYDKIEVLSCGKNLFDIKDTSKYELYNVTLDTTNNILTLTANTSSYPRAYYDLTGSQFNGASVLHIKGSVDGTSSNNAMYVRLYDGTTSISEIKAGKGNIDTTIDISGLTRPRILFYVWAGGTAEVGVTMVVSDFIISLDSATTYEPYHKTTDLSENLPQTVYGGTLDVENGVLRVDYETLSLASMDWGTTNTGQMYTAGVSRFAKIVGESTDYAKDFKLNCFNAVIGSDVLTNIGDAILFYRHGSYTGYRLFIKSQFESTSAGIDAFKQQLTDYDAKICYELADEYKTEIQLTPTEIELLKGYNYLSTNGTTIALDYRDGEMATLGDVLDAQNKLQEEIDNPISYDGKNYRLGMDDTGLYLYNITDDTKTYIQMVTP